MMFFKCKWLEILFALSLVIICLGCSEENNFKENSIIIAGSTTACPIIEIVAARYMQENDVIIDTHCESSKNGFNEFTERECAIAISSTKVPASLFDYAESKGIKVKEFALAYDMIVPIIHPTNQIEDLSLEQLRDIFMGSVKNWSDLGGKPENILVVTRDKFSGTREVWNNIVVKSAIAAKDHEVVYSNSEVLSFVAQNPNSIGYISFAYVNPEIKTVSVNGIKSSLENGKNKKYPIRRKLYLYVDETIFSRDIKSFVIYLLSKEGQDIIKENGFLPLYPLSIK